MKCKTLCMEDEPKKPFLSNVVWWKWLIVAAISLLVYYLFGGDSTYIGMIARVVWIISFASGLILGLKSILDRYNNK